MPWPAIITEAFELARTDGQTDESRFYGPFNMLLNYLFPFEDRYMIVPQWKCPEQSKLVDFTTIFIVSHNKHSVFFIEIKPSDHIRNYSPRALADKQMRERFEDLGDCVHIASTE